MTAEKTLAHPITVAEFDAFPESHAKELLEECCGSSEWVRRVLARRPFRSRGSVLATADEIWKSLDREDWLDAFRYHPRIGERASGPAAQEQSGIESASGATAVKLADANQEYERRFGYIYIVCATGKSADEMLAIVLQRLNNDPDTEIEVAAEEQRKITRLRLEKLLEN